MPKFSISSNSSTASQPVPTEELFTVFFEGTFDGATVFFEVQGESGSEWHPVFSTTVKAVKNIEFNANAYRVRVTGAGVSTNVEVIVV